MSNVVETPVTKRKTPANAAVGYGNLSAPTYLFMIKPSMNKDWFGDMFTFENSSPFTVDFNPEAVIIDDPMTGSPMPAPLLIHFMVKIDNANESGDIWYFSDSDSDSDTGIEFLTPITEGITTKLLDPQTLMLTIASKNTSANSSIRPNKKYSFVFLAKRAGDTTLYRSQDPSIAIKSGSGVVD